MNGINALNPELYINTVKYKYQKYFKPEKEGIYEIKLKFNINIKDCSLMFYNCSKLRNLDLSSFDSKNVTNKKSESTEESVEEKQYNNFNLD